MEAFERELTDETTTFFREVSQSGRDASIEFIEAREYFDDPASSYTDLKPEQKYSSVDGLKVLPQSELPEGAKWGVRYEGWVLNSPVYLLWLRKQLEQEDVKFIRGKVHKDIADEAVNLIRSELNQPDLSFVAFVNATGTGINDPASHISRGQFLRISNTYDKTISHHYADGSSTVIVPRPNGGGTLIGGSKEPGNYDTSPNEEITKWIIESVSKLSPDLLETHPDAEAGKRGLDVTHVTIGRRPLRKGGVRIEYEAAAQGGVPVVHCYGAGGSGYKISWGAAGKVLKIVESQC